MENGLQQANCTNPKTKFNKLSNEIFQESYVRFFFLFFLFISKTVKVPDCSFNAIAKFNSQQLENCITFELLFKKKFKLALLALLQSRAKEFVFNLKKKLMKLQNEKAFINCAALRECRSIFSQKIQFRVSAATWQINVLQH